MRGKPFVFSWSRWSIDHIAEHGVEPDEAEHIVVEAAPPYPRLIGEEKWQVWGQTPRGRYLQVIYFHPADEDVDPSSLSPDDLAEFSAGRVRVVCVIHARSLTDREKRKLRKRR